MKKILAIIAILGLLAFFFTPRAEAVTLVVGQGGTGTSTAPTYGQLLLGNALGGYNLVSTSTLNFLTAGGWTKSGTSVSLTASTTDNVNIGTATSTARLTLTASSSIGAELITNGGFTGSATGWTLENCWTYSNNAVYASLDGVCDAYEVYQSYTLTEGYYRVEFDSFATTSTAELYIRYNQDYTPITVLGEHATTSYSYDFQVTQSGMVTVGFSMAGNVGDSFSMDNYSLKRITVHANQVGYDHNGTLLYSLMNNGLGDVAEFWGNILFGSTGLQEESRGIKTETVSTTTGDLVLYSDGLYLEVGSANSSFTGGESYGGGLSLYAGSASTTIGSGGDIWLGAGYIENLLGRAYGSHLNLNSGSITDVDVTGASWSLSSDYFEWYGSSFSQGTYPSIECNSPYFGSLNNISQSRLCQFGAGGWNINGTSTAGNRLQLYMPFVSGDDIETGLFSLGGAQIDAGLASPIYGATIECGGSGYSSSTYEWWGGSCDINAGDSGAGSGVGGSINLQAGSGRDIEAGTVSIGGGSGTNVAGGDVYIYGGDGTSDNGDIYLRNAGFNVLSIIDRVVDMTQALAIQIINGTAPTVDAGGEIAIDTTSDQFLFYGTAKNVVTGYQYPSFTYSTTTAWTGTTTIYLGTAFVAETWSQVQCFTDTGTVNVSFYDGTNRMNMFNASTTIGTVTLSTNNTFTAAEKRMVDIGTPASTPTKLSCTVKKSITAD